MCEPARHWKCCCLPRVAEPAAALLLRGAAGQGCKQETHIPSSCPGYLRLSFYCSMCAKGSGLGSAGCEELLWSFLLPISTHFHHFIQASSQLGHFQPYRAMRCTLRDEDVDTSFCSAAACTYTFCKAVISHDTFPLKKAENRQYA